MPRRSGLMRTAAPTAAAAAAIVGEGVEVQTRIGEERI
jgi:hypothetical protein